MATRKISVYNVAIYDDFFGTITKNIPVGAISLADLRVFVLQELIDYSQHTAHPKIGGEKYVAYLGAVIGKDGYVKKFIGKITYIHGQSKVSYYDSAKHEFYWMNPETGHITPKTRKDNSLALFPRI